jgi:hypothetical protein
MNRISWCLPLAVVPLSLSAHAASAATGNINFSGSVASTCALAVTNSSGVMTTSSNLQGLSSKNAGGVHGVINLTTTGGVSLSIDSVTTSTQPTADQTPTTWVPTYSVTGLQTINDTAASSTVSNNGVGTINVHLSGTKSGSATFVNGTYTATVVVRCEP